jgi:hypothetical protein
MRRRRPEVLVLKMEELETILERAGTSALDEESIKKLKAMGETLAWLMGELEKKRIDIKRLCKILFGAKNTEKTSEVLGKENKDDQEGSQPGDAEESAKEEKESTKEEKKKRKGHGRNGADSYRGAERIKVPHESLCSGDHCPECEKGKVYGLREPRVLVRVTGQAPLQATVYEIEALRCNLCGVVFRAKTPDDVGEKKYDESSAAMIGLLNYGSGMPFNRLERLEGYLQIPLPASTQWDIVSKAAGLLFPARDELIRLAAKGDVLYNDDTKMKILSLIKENELIEATSSKDRTGMFTSGIVSILEGRHIVLFFTGRKHAGENIEDVLRERAKELHIPIQMCDGSLQSVPKELETILSNCLTHGRRKFVEVAPYFPEECRYVLEVLMVVYKNDAVAREQKMSDQERLLFHQAHSAGPMNDLKSWMTEQIEENKVEPNSSLGAAIAYMLKRWDKLTLFLSVPGAPLDNNICERALKMAIRHRKNSLFYRTENGAKVGDIFMSLIYTAELAAVNPFEYLTVLLKHAEHLKRAPHEWMPWNYLATAAAMAEAARS